jgi:hypothetical protein
VIDAIPGDQGGPIDRWMVALAKLAKQLDACD